MSPFTPILCSQRPLGTAVERQARTWAGNPARSPALMRMCPRICPHTPALCLQFFISINEGLNRWPSGPSKPHHFIISKLIPSGSLPRPGTSVRVRNQTQSYSGAQLSNLIQPEIGESQQRWGRREGREKTLLLLKKEINSIYIT